LAVGSDLITPGPWSSVSVTDEFVLRISVLIRSGLREYVRYTLHGADKFGAEWGATKFDCVFVVRFNNRNIFCLF